MKIVLLDTKKTEEYPDLYAMRLIEQGKAVPAPAPKAAKAKKTEAVKAKEPPKEADPDVAEGQG